MTVFDAHNTQLSLQQRKRLRANTKFHLAAQATGPRTIQVMDPRAEAVLKALNGFTDEQLAAIVSSALAEDKPLQAPKRTFLMPSANKKNKQPPTE